MKDFLALHQSKITGVLGCFDRVIFRGYLPIQDGNSMAQFLNQNGLRFRDLKSFLFEQSNRVKFHAQAWAERESRPFVQSRRRKCLCLYVYVMDPRSWRPQEYREDRNHGKERKKP